MFGTSDATEQRYRHAGQCYFDGEVELCINGRTIETGAYFGVDVAAIAERILGERLDDGGWNSEVENGSVRSSFDTTINVLDGLSEFERVTGGSAEVRAARHSGEEYLLDRIHPGRVHFDVEGAWGRRAAGTPSGPSGCSPGGTESPDAPAADGERAPLRLRGDQTEFPARRHDGWEDGARYVPTERIHVGSALHRHPIAGMYRVEMAIGLRRNRPHTPRSCENCSTR